MDTLESHEPAGDEEAKIALREFFSAVHALYGQRELLRIYESFYFQAHQTFPPVQADWSDKTGDGDLKVNNPMAARGGL